MRLPIALSVLLVAAPITPVALHAAPAPLFVLSDPTQDDHGDGTLKYPLVADMREGDLDLVELSAQPADGGAWFVVTMRRNVRPPGPEVVDSLGRTKAEIARLGFWEFNVDIYVDKDRVEGSGQLWTLPGRKVSIDPKTAWERMISLSPQPDQSAIMVRRVLNEQAKEQVKAEQPRVDPQDLEAARTMVSGAMESHFWFARNVQVSGRRVKFFVPDAFLGGPPSPDWAYTVLVTGATLEPRFDMSRLIGKAALEDDNLLIPVGTALSPRHFAGREDDPLQPPVIDTLVPPGQRQEDVLRDYDVRTGRMAQLTGVVPGAPPAKR